jgi:hypothetical protein
MYLFTHLGPCEHGGVRLQTSGVRECFHMCSVAANILKKQIRIATRTGSPAWGLGEGSALSAVYKNTAETSTTGNEHEIWNLESQ